MIFDPSITLGALLNAVALLIGFVVAFTRIGGRIDLLAQRLVSVEETLKASSDTKSRITRIEEQVTTTMRDISDLRRGNGFITANRPHIDREYP